MKPVFYASEVAALIGKHQYKSVDEALFRVLSSDPKWKPLIKRVKGDTGAKTEKEIVESAPESVKEHIQRAVKSSVEATTQAEVTSTIEEFQRETSKALLKDAIECKENALPDFKAAAERIKEGKTTFEEEAVRLETIHPVTVITREIQKQRGTKLEAKAEDDFGDVHNRNAPVRYECDEYIIVGYIDGMKNGKIVETKNRKRFWREPPNYDVIQLRCYMKMRGEIGGVLLECFPGKDPRSTEYAWDENMWVAIHNNLVEVADRLSNMSSAEAETIVRTALLTKTNRSTVQNGMVQGGE